MYHYHGFFGLWCQKVLPLVYDESLSYYELLCKLVKHLQEFAENVDQMDSAIADIIARLTELEKHGFTNEQLREVLDQMVADGEFDFLVDMINAKTALWDIVGMRPYAQVLPEKVNVEIAGYGLQSMAFGVIEGVKVGFFGFVHKTGDEDDGSLAITYNLTTGIVLGSSTTFSGHMNSVGFNPNDKKFYVTPGGNWGKIVVYDMYCHIDKEINTADDNWKAGGITFNRNSGNAYVVWYSKDGGNATLKINEIEHLENYNTITPLVYDRQSSWDREYIYSVGRQDIYCDDEYIYMPTWWHQNGEYYRPRYAKQDVFSISTLEYVKTQFIDSDEEVNGGEYFEDEYYLGVNIAHSGLICKSSVKQNNDYNSAYVKIAQMHAFDNNYGPLKIYGDGTSTVFFADGSSTHPINRLQALKFMAMPYSRFTGIELLLTGDFTREGEITNISFRNCNNRLLFTGLVGCVLPKITIDNCKRVVFDGLEITTYDSDYCLYAFDCDFVLLKNVHFTNSDTDNTISSVININNSVVKIDDTGKAGFDGTTPTAYVRTRNNSCAIGKFYRDYTITGSGTSITFSEFTFAGTSGVNSHVIGVVNPAGITAEGLINLNANINANTVIATLPSNNRQNLQTNVLSRSDYSYFFGVGEDGTVYRFRYIYSDNTIETLDALTSGDSIAVNAIFTVETVVV